MPLDSCRTCYSSPCLCYSTETSDVRYTGYAHDDTNHHGPPLPRYETRCRQCSSKPCVCSTRTTGSNGVCTTCYAKPCCCYANSTSKSSNDKTTNKAGEYRCKTCNLAHSQCYCRTHPRYVMRTEHSCKTCNLPYSQCCCGTHPRYGRRGEHRCKTCDLPYSECCCGTRKKRGGRLGVFGKKY
jgi:hypothetical protein